MRLIYVCLTISLVFFSSLVGAAPPDSPFPIAPPAPAPLPVPPTPTPGGFLTLTPDTLYVVNSKVDAVLRAHPVGLVKVTKEVGPIKIRGKFVDGTGKTETRTFVGPCVYVLEAADGARGTLELDLIPVGFKTEADILTATVNVDAGQAPLPPPKPVDPKPVDPKPVDPVTSFRVILIYESGDTLTAAQRGVVFGKAVEDFLTANCTGGKNGWRRRDKDAPGENDATMTVLWAAIKPNITTTPCVAVERNGKVELINLEPTPAKMVEVLQTYKGK